MSQKVVDVVVVGAGTAGLATAIGFALQNKRVVLLERATHWEHALDDQLYDMRVFAINHASQHLLETLGAWPQIKQRACAYTDMSVWNTTGRVEFSCEEVHRLSLGHIIEHNVLLNALKQQCERIQNTHALEIVMGACIEHITGLDTHQPTITLSHGETFAPKIVVGADGHQSFIRTQAGITVREQSYEQLAIVSTLRTEYAHQDTAWQRFLPTGPLAYLPLPDVIEAEPCGHYSSIVWTVDKQTAAELLALDSDAFASRVASAFEYTLGRVEEIGPRGSFALANKHAQHYVQKGLALVGDAAHMIHPLAGQGMNLGFRDVAALLQACKDHGMRQTALAHYQRQCKTHNEITLQSMSAINTLFGHSSSLVDSIRNIGLDRVNKTPWLKRQFAKHASGLAESTT